MLAALATPAFEPPSNVRNLWDTWLQGTTQRVTTPRGGPHGQKLMRSCTHSPTTHLRDGWSAWGPSLECGRLAPLLGSPPRETQLCPQSCLSGATLPRKQASPLCSILKKKIVLMINSIKISTYYSSVLKFSNVYFLNLLFYIYLLLGSIGWLYPHIKRCYLSLCFSDVHTYLKFSCLNSC